MKLFYLSTFLLLSCLQLRLHAQDLPAYPQPDTSVYTGVYNGKNLYMQNPLSGDGKTYCAQAVYVNGEHLFDAPQASAFVINLNHLPPGTQLRLKVVHATNCVPKLINPQVLVGGSKFKFLSVSLDSTQLFWRSGGEKESGKFFVEKMLNGAWQTVQALPGRAGTAEDTYAVKIRMHAGDNRFRIKYLQADGQLFYSKVVQYESKLKPVSFTPSRVSDKIYLSAPTDYLVVSAEGRVLMKGFGKEIMLAHLSPGLYYLRIENRNEKFYKK